MKKFLLFFLISFSVFSQSEEKALKEFSKVFCSCMEKEHEERMKIWEKCSKEMIKTHPDLLRQIGSGLRGNNGSLKQEFWDKINNELTYNCDKYNELITESFVDKNQVFTPLIENIGNQICNKVSSFKSIDDAKIQSVMIPFLKKNQRELIETLGSPKKVMKNLNDYLSLNCIQYRNYQSRVSLKKK